jgi:hypothetical protein
MNDPLHTLASAVILVAAETKPAVLANAISHWEQVADETWTAGPDPYRSNPTSEAALYNAEVLIAHQVWLFSRSRKLRRSPAVALWPERYV